VETNNVLWCEGRPFFHLKCDYSFFCNILFKHHSIMLVNPQKLWSKLNLLLAKSSETVLLDASDPRSLDNTFCDFFVQKVLTIRQHFFCSDPIYVKHSFHPPIFDKFVTISEQDLCTFVLNATWMQVWFPWSLAKIFHQRKYRHYTSFVNQVSQLSMSQWIFPRCFKNAVVTPPLKIFSRQGLRMTLKLSSYIMPFISL
jgi:hypothetical protein